MPQYNFPTRPVADSDAIIKGENYRFTIINDVVIRYEWASDGIFEDRASTFAVNRQFSQRPKPLVKETPDSLEIITPALHLFYDKKRFSAHGLMADMKSKTTLWGAHWKYGWKPEANLGGTARTLDDVNGRCDMGEGILSKAGYAVIDDSESMLFDEEGFASPRRPGERVDGYLFSYGRDFKAAMKAYFDISGHTPRLPRWALGNWWSRFYAYTSESYLGLMDQFRAHGIPMSVAVIDMDWHLVGEEEVVHAGWTGYTWNRKLFPDPAGFALGLHQRGIKMTLNDHPHAGVAAHEDQYEEVARYLGHDTSGEKTTIHFDPSNAKFLEAFFQILHRDLERKGCDFWWIDWQQGPISRIPGLDPLWLLNHYQFLDSAQQMGDKNALVFSRYAGPGSHRYPVGFSGDTIVTWESLAFQPEFTATASNIGYGWWSHDIGGHMFGTRDDELVARWVQFGVLSPIMRLHSSNSQWGSKEPWLYRPDAEATISFFMKLRHRLIPYLHSANAVFAREGETIVQPLYWRYPQRDEAFDYPNQYFFGQSLVVAPIVQSRDGRTLHASAKAWLPPSASRHVDIFTGTVYDSDREVDLWRTLQDVPVLAPEGSIIPLDAASEPANGGGNPDRFELLVVIGQDGKFTIVEDGQDDSKSRSGEENERAIEIDWNQKSGVLTVNSPTDREWTIRFLSVLDQQLPDIKVSGSSTIQADVSINELGSRYPGTIVNLPDAVNGTFTVALGENPQLSVLDNSARIRSLLHDFQIEFSLKDAIFAITEAKQPVGVKVGRLLGLGLEAAVVGPIAELLVADSRSM